jgi:hypothetical protein
MRAPTRDLTWLQDSLQAAIQVELTTIPPYLAAMWSLKDPTSGNCSKANSFLFQVVLEEMLHMALACNMLCALGREPLIADAAPTYPGPLPGGVHPGLSVTIKRYCESQLKTFLTIEYPKGGPVALFWSRGTRYATIGQFYTAIYKAFDDPAVVLPATFDTKDQLLLPAQLPDLTLIKSKTDAQAAIKLIQEQGEGTSKSPFEPGGSIASDFGLAHYYKFGELYFGHQIRANPDPHPPLPYDFHGPAIKVPSEADVFPMADVPKGGFGAAKDFDSSYSNLLRQLQKAWQEGNGDGTSTNMDTAMNVSMPALTTEAQALLLKLIPAPGGLGIVGPSFQYTP